MRTLDKGRVVRLVKPEGTLAAGTIGRVLRATRVEALIQAAPGSRTITGDLFEGHDGEGQVRTRAWYVPRAVIRSTREKVANAREFASRYGA